LSDERREEFLERSVVNYSLVRKSEKFMGAGDRILIDARQLIYLFTRPVFYYHAIDQAQIVARNVEADPKVFLNQLRRQRVTMLLIRWPVGSSKEPSDLANAAQVLADRGCAREIESMSTISFASRSMKDVDTIVPATLYRLTEDGCQLL
jgi:hypothetical protein